MTINFYITFLIPILIVFLEYPLFIELIILKNRRNKSLLELIIGNLICCIISNLYFKYSSKEIYIWIFIELIIINVIYLVYLIFLKDSISSTFDSNDFINKDEYFKTMIEYNEKNIKISNIFAILKYIYIPIGILFLIFYRDNFIEIIIQEILIISNWIVWKKSSYIFEKEIVDSKDT
ncbi:hypothetical protein PMY12_08690 [Clostridium tertium]|jgi:hypothetical protein|uniref:hypothetical protein n=2 Tax=Clostridium tertium TaxID=1559 RepID=UPI00232E77F5|nr:hypothetical protein [Clostridium tertium]MDB1934035.1 hypothetical protein [Clostridium tertium]MDB1937090.1 hypothetical protein [Clostridium tertium]